VYTSAIPLPANLAVSNLTVMIGSTAFVGVTHGWFALIDKNMVVRAVTADQTTALDISFSNVKLATTGTYTTTYGGLYYVGFCATAGTMGTLIVGPSTLTTPNSTAPVLCGTAGTFSAPPGLGGTLTSIVFSNVTQRFYGSTA
jgi:hypothetical protein